MKPKPLVITLFILALALTCAAKVKGPFVCSRIHSQAQAIVADDSLRIKIPKKHDAVVLVENAYTKRVRKGLSIAPADVDSIEVWMPTAPTVRHTIVYFPPYGWCWQLENTPGLCVYAFCKKGYRLWGNGGIQPCGKYILLVVKKGAVTEFSKTWKKADNSFRRKVAALVADDPVLAAEILKSRTRRDKTIRMLRLYNPVY